MAEVTGKQVGVGLLVLTIGLAFLAPTTFEKYTGIKLGESDGDGGGGDAWNMWDNNVTATTTPPTVEPPITRACLKHAYTFGSASNPVRVYVNDMLNPKAGIGGLEMEVLNVPTAPYTLSKLFAIASDPMREVVDEDTNTSAGGAAEFVSNSMLVYMDYLFALRGDSNVYDKVLVKLLPCIPPEREGFTFPGKVYSYYVGNFSSLYTSNNYTENITGKTGIQFISFDITIGEDQAGKALKKPTVTLRSPEGYELEPGDVVSIYLIRKSGVDFGIPGINLIDYVTGETPIPLKGSIFDEDYSAYMMTVADSGVYTVKLSYDADQIQAAGDRLMIAVDDLDGYREKDDVTKSIKAPAETVTVMFTT